VIVILSLVTAKINKWLGISLGVVAIMGLLSFLDPFFVESWCYFPKEMVNHSLRGNLWYENKINSTERVMAAGIIKYECEDEFHLPQIIWASIFPNVKKRWDQEKLHRIETIAIQSYQLDLQDFLAEDNLEINFVGRKIKPGTKIERNDYWYYFENDKYNLVVQANNHQVMKVKLKDKTSLAPKNKLSQSQLQKLAEEIFMRNTYLRTEFELKQELDTNKLYHFIWEQENAPQTIELVLDDEGNIISYEVVFLKAKFLSNF
jgi:hypothetical protein